MEVRNGRFTKTADSAVIDHKDIVVKHNGEWFYLDKLYHGAQLVWENLGGGGGFHVLGLQEIYSTSRNLSNITPARSWKNAELLVNSYARNNRSLLKFSHDLSTFETYAWQWDYLKPFTRTEHELFFLYWSGDWKGFYYPSGEFDGISAEYSIDTELGSFGYIYRGKAYRSEATVLTEYTTVRKYAMTHGANGYSLEQEESKNLFLSLSPEVVHLLRGLIISVTDAGMILTGAYIEGNERIEGAFLTNPALQSWEIVRPVSGIFNTGSTIFGDYIYTVGENQTLYKNTKRGELLESYELENCHPGYTGAYIYLDRYALYWYQIGNSNPQYGIAVLDMQGGGITYLDISAQTWPYLYSLFGSINQACIEDGNTLKIILYDDWGSDKKLYSLTIKYDGDFSIT